MGTDNVNSTAPRPTGENELFRNMKLASLVLYCVIFIMGTLGNGLVIYVTGFRMKKTVNSVWFLNLALADFLFTGFLIFTIIYVSKGQWIFGRLMCKLNSFVGIVNMFASIFLLMAISLDRCLSIWVVVWAQNKRTVRKAQLICLFIWLTAMACSTPFACFREIAIYPGKTVCSYSRYITDVQLHSLNIFRFVVGFLVPFLVIMVSYVAIVVRARRLHGTRKKRSWRIIFSVVLAFFICWLPFHIFCFIEYYYKTNTSLRTVVRIGGNLVVILAFVNSCLNPILYVFMCDEFQKKLKQSICVVLESALAEDHLTFMSSRSLSSHFSRIARKSDSAEPVEMKDATTSSLLTEKKVNNTVEK